MEIQSPSRIRLLEIINQAWTAPLRVNRYRCYLVATALALPGLFGFSGVQAATPQSETSGLTLEQRIARVERLLANQDLFDLYQRMESLQKEVETLRGEIEVLNHRQEETRSHQKSLYVHLDQRLEKLEQVAPTESFPASPQPKAANENAAALAAAGLTEQDAYQNAFGFLKQGRYDDALPALKAFLVGYPQSEFADNAQYWLGETYYVMRRYDFAIAEFSKIIQLYPASAKVADAYLKIGFSYYEIQDWVNARAALERVTTQFPESGAAPLAKKRIDQMRADAKIQ